MENNKNNPMFKIEERIKAAEAESAEMADTLATLDLSATAKPAKRKKFGTLRAAIVGLILFTLLLGVVYPVSVTLAAQALFPYQANGSQITVTLADGTKKVYGSELIGQSFNDSTHLVGRINLGGPTNLSPKSGKFMDNATARRNYLTNKNWSEKVTDENGVEQTVEHVNENNGFGFSGDIPAELVTSSGSGCDPHVSPETAHYQVKSIVAARNAAAAKNPELNIKTVTEQELIEIIDRYTEGRFLLIFGEKRVNVLFVNLAIEGLVK